MSLAGEAGLSKATLRVVSGTPKRLELRFLYNPTEYTVTKGSTWNRPQTSGAKSATKPQFGGTNPQTAPDGDLLRRVRVGRRVHRRRRRDAPRLDHGDRRVARPEEARAADPDPRLGPQPGARHVPRLSQVRECQVHPVRHRGQSIAGQRERDPRGGAQREARPEPDLGQSGGQDPARADARARRSSRSPGPSIGDATLWRALATFNGIDDPMRIPLGTAVLVPTLDEATRLV